MVQFYSSAKANNSFLFRLLALIVVFVSTQQLIAQPVISSFSPTTGAAGTAVTITGANFSITPTNNAVYFGTVKATVTAASYTSLTVTVPPGALYQPISVTTGGLTAYSTLPFMLTYQGKGTITTSSFTKADASLGSNYYNPQYMAAADLDGDGKMEIVATFPSSIAVFRPGTEGTVEYSLATTVNSASSGTPNPRAISIGDLDGDGLQDIVYVNFSAQSLVIYRNKSTPGKYSFVNAGTFTTGGQPASTGIRDLNGDGKPEIVATVANSTSVNIYRNNSTPGSISMSAGLFLTCDANAAELTINDFDGDGNADIAIGNSYNTYIAVFRNTTNAGSLSFSPKTDYLLAGYTVSMCSGDIDGDGKPELVIANSTANSISVLRNTSTNGNISFATRVDYASGASPISVIMSDMNGDGKTDVEVANNSSNTVAFFQNNSSPGTVTLAPRVDYGSTGTAMKLCSADFNQDGKPDLAVANSNLNTISIYKNSSNNEPVINSFTPTNAQTGSNVIITGGDFTGATAVSFGGFPATSFVVQSSTQITATVGQASSGTVAVTTPNGIATASGFEYAPKITSFTPTSNVPNNLLTTIKGEGFSPIPAKNIVYFGATKGEVWTASPTQLDVMVKPGATYAPISVTVGGVTGYSQLPFNPIYNNGGGNFNSNSFAAKVDLAAGYDPMQVAISDFDNDGRPDIAAAVRYTGFISLYRNTGVSFATKVDITAQSNTYSIAAADLNGDGKPDLISANSLAMTVTTFKNTSGNGYFSFEPAQIASGYYTGNQAAWVKVADMDGDGKPDLVIGNNSPNVVTIFRNTSTINNISFAPKVDFPVVDNSKNLAVGDIDGDGKPDVAVITNGQVKIFKNTCTPGVISLSEAGYYSTPYWSRFNELCDLDGDGKLDLAVTNETINVVSIFKNASNSGTISFAPRTDFPVGTTGGTSGFAVGDLNGDRRPDLAVPISGNKVAVLNNTSANGVISFAPSVDFATGYSAINAAIGDINADTKPDIITANYNGNLSSISVLKNTHQPAPPKITSFSPTTAESGVEITIKGTGFFPGTNVTFQRTSALSVNVTSDTTMIAVTGAGETGFVYINNSAGQDSLGTFTFVPAAPHIQSFSPANAKRGDTVTIKGSHLAGTSTIYFGNVPAPNFKINSDSVITAVVGTGASGYVRIAARYGTDSLAGFTYTPVVPVITSFAPTAVRQGDLVTIKGSNFTGTSAISFGGVPATSISLTSDSVVSAIVGPGGTGDVVVTGPDGSASASGFTYTGTTISSFTPAIAGNGILVTINGTNLRNATNISFGGTKATSFTVVSDNTITAIVGSGSTGAVSVTTPQGSNTKTGFLWLNPPVINSFTPPLGDVGDTVIINGKYFTYTDSVWVGGTLATSFKILTDTSIAAVVGTGSTGDISVKSVGGIATKGTFTFKGAPLITSFTPATAASGATVSISGIRFGKMPADNIVYFGAVKAQVLTASATNLTVKVPYGATLAPITITTAAGTGFSPTQFILTFRGGDTTFTQNSFAARVDLPATGTVNDGAIIDLYEDGKPDLVSASEGPGTLSRFKNTSSPGTIAFDPKSDFAANYDIEKMTVSDLNGDGKPDFATGNIRDLQVGAAYTNTSTNGNVSISAALPLLNNSPGNQYVASADLDGDGKPEVAVVGWYGGGVGIFQNTSTGNTTSFAPVYSFVSRDRASDIAFSDLDMDGKPDLVINNLGYVLVFRNIGKPGMILFGPMITLNTLSGSSYDSHLAIADIDGDGKPEICAMQGSVCIFRNIGKPGSIVFEACKYYATGRFPGDLSVGDLNGDGKPDLIGCNKDDKTVSLYKNNSQPGTISMMPKVDLLVDAEPRNAEVGDLDGDGKPELVVFCSNKVSIFKNMMNYIPAPVITSFTPATGFTGTIVTIKGKDLTGATTVSFGGTSAASFTVLSDTIITATVGSGGTGDVIVATAAGADTMSGFTFVVPVYSPAITSFTPTSGNNGTTVTIKGSHFTGATAVNFGGITAGSFTVVSDSVITAIVGTGSTGAVRIITSNGTDSLSGFTYITESGNDQTITLAPNPATGFVIVTHPVIDGNAQIKLIDMLGNIVQTVVVSPNTSSTRLNLVSIKQGTYTILYNNGTDSFSKLILVQ